MATETVNQPAYGLTLDDTNALSSAAQKLRALLMHTFGESGEAFRFMDEPLQDNYLWMCSDLAGELVRLSEKMERLA